MIGWSATGKSRCASITVRAGGAELRASKKMRRLGEAAVASDDARRIAEMPTTEKRQRGGRARRSDDPLPRRATLARDSPHDGVAKAERNRTRRYAREKLVHRTLGRFEIARAGSAQARLPFKRAARCTLR